jgi:hypothetical protein
MSLFVDTDVMKLIQKQTKNKRMCNSYVTVWFLLLDVPFDWPCHVESDVSGTNTDLLTQIELFQRVACFPLEWIF